MSEANLLPHVVIGGAPRSGTTFLCEVLVKHPGVYIRRPFIPEPKVCLTPHPAGNHGLRERYSVVFKDAPASAIRIEKTANYFENDAARERLLRLLPDTKFIFILRDPVARAYSNWLWSTANGLETLCFTEALAQEGRRPSPFPPERDYVRPFDYLKRSNYGILAEAWIQCLGRDRIAFFIFEKALADPASFVEQLQRFVGVEPKSWDTLKTEKINANPLLEPELDPALEMLLRRQFEPEMRRFAKATGLDLAVWGY